ncbi:chitobiase/beta-hexosaminidase C-terminal domain-containing protein [Prevotella sp.]|uniref:chitobiase/beta-hexosaminidase C-terminal domain-containing protein n=1 Tax=Prevotella sp. TaxID=59823 RepID=UPI003AB5398E
MKNFTHKKRNGLALWLLTLMCLASVNVWGQETVYSYELKQKTWYNDGSLELAGINWSLDAPGAGYWGYDGTKGQQIGSGGNPATSINLSTEDFKGTIKSVVIETSGASKINATIQVKVGNVGYGDETKITKTNTPYKFDGQSSGKVEVIWTNTSDAAIYLKKITVTYEEGAATQCIAPTFSPASGTSFANTLTVTASTATEGGKIVYTTDPEATLDANSPEFPSEGLTIDATTTIRAITVDPNGALENSSEASATYTKIDALNGLAELRTKIREDNVTSQKDAKEYIVSLNNAVVTKVSGNKAFIEENGTGIQYFNYDNSFKEGQVINGTATVKGFMYSNWAELTSIEGDITITDGGAVAPTEVTLEELTNNYDKYESRLVKVTAAEVTSAFNIQNGEISQNGFKFAVRANDESISMTLGETIDIIGVPGIYFDTKQLNVFSQDDITKDENAKTFSWTATSAEIDINSGDITALPTLTNTYEGAVNYDSSNKGVATIGETDGQITIVGAGTTTITATLASDPEVKSSYELTVNKTTATLEFEQSSYTVNFDEIITLKAVSNNPDAQITYSTTDGDWYIDEKSGEFLAGTTAGKVTVTATMAESDKYTGATATCTVNIVDPNQQVYKKVTSQEDITDGDTYLIISEEYNKALSEINVSDTRGIAVDVTIADDIYSNQTNAEGLPYEYTISTTGDGRYSIKNTQGYLAIIKGDKTNLTVSETETENCHWTITYQDGKVLLKGNAGGRILGYNSSANCFRYYDENTSTYNNITLYKKVTSTTGSFSITDAGFATYYTDKAFVMPENVQGGIVTKANKETNQLTISYNYQPGTVVPAKTPIVLKGEKGDYTINYTTSEETAPAGNMLYGAENVDADGMTFVKGTNVKYYKLALGNDGKCGFYWGATDGAAFEYTANRAFLAIDITDASQAPASFSLDGDGSTTAINGIMNGNDDSQKIYTVTGVYAGKSLNNLPKGIYIVGGKKVAVK